MHDLIFRGFTLTQQEQENGKTTITIQQGENTITLTPEEMGLIASKYFKCYKLITNAGSIKAIRTQ